MEVLLLVLLGRKRKLCKASSINSKEQCGPRRTFTESREKNSNIFLVHVYILRSGLNEVNDLILSIPPYTLV